MLGLLTNPVDTFRLKMIAALSFVCPLPNGRGSATEHNRPLYDEMTTQDVCHEIQFLRVRRL